MIGNASDDAVSSSCEQIFDQFISAVTCKSILTSFNQLLDVTGLRHADHRHFYEALKIKLRKSWKAQTIWAKLDKRSSHRDYKKQQACANLKVLVIGSGPCGLRTAIECAFLGAKTVVVEKRDRFSRNNVLHLWPYLITDLRNLGAKKFFGKFCAGAIDHISIRQLQCILLKVALLLGVEVHVNVAFEHLIEPPADQSTGWHCKVLPENHPVSEYEFNALIAADGKRNTLPGFKRKEFRGKLAIAVTANFINRNTQAEARVEEISGVAFIFNQKFFLDLKEKTRIDLENIVYYKDDTHYFVMTAKKASLLEKGVLKEDYSDTVALLDRANVNQEALMAFACEAADFSTNYQLPTLEYAVNHYGQADVAMFDFTSMFAAENASRFVYKNGHHLLMGLVGDTLLEPFWPTGSGCARGFLGAFDAAWMIRSWALGRTPLQVLAERESIFTVLSQTTPSYLHKNHNAYSIDPNTRYPNLNLKAVKPAQVRHLYEGGVVDEKELEEEDAISTAPVNKALYANENDLTVDSYTLLRWCQKVLNTGKYRDVHIVDFTSSWRSGLALCALIHSFRPELIQNTLLMECEVASNNQLAFNVAEKELGISPVMTGEDMARNEVIDKLTMITYLSRFYEVFKNEPLPSTIALPSKSKRKSLPLDTLKPKPLQSPKRHISLLQKLSSRSKKRKEQEENDQITFGFKKKKEKEEKINVELTHYNKLPMEEIANRLQLNRKAEDARLKVSKNEERSGAVSVTAMADLLVSKFKSFEAKPPQELMRKLKGQPTLLAATPESEFCSFCHKKVYIMERMSAEGEFFHRGCFRCDHCGVSLRLSNYSCDRDTKPVKFYCYRHTLPELRLKTQKVKNLEDKNMVKIPELFKSSPLQTDMCNVFNENISNSSQMSSSQLLAKGVTEGRNMQERVEFEISFDGCEEESEEEQFEHNLRASLSNTLSDDSDDTDSYSDFESDEELWESALESLKSPMLSSDLQRSWEAYNLESNVLHDSLSLNYVSFKNDQERDDSSTEVEEDSDEQVSSKKQPEDDSSREEVSQKSLLSPVSKISLSKANFFSEPPTVVSLDPWSMFGMATQEIPVKLTPATDLLGKIQEDQMRSETDSGEDTDMSIDNMPEEMDDDITQGKRCESENDGDDEHKEKNKAVVCVDTKLKDMPHSTEVPFIEGRLSPSASKAKKFRMKRQMLKYTKNNSHSMSTDSDIPDLTSPQLAAGGTKAFTGQGATPLTETTLLSLSNVSDSSDIDDLIIANIDDRFVTSRHNKPRIKRQHKAKKKLHKKKSKSNKEKKGEEFFTPIGQIYHPLFRQDNHVKVDITKTSNLALVESFSDSDNGSVNADNSAEQNLDTAQYSLPDSPGHDTSSTDIFFSPTQNLNQPPLFVTTTDKSISTSESELSKFHSQSSDLQSDSSSHNTDSQTSTEKIHSQSSLEISHPKTPHLLSAKESENLSESKVRSKLPDLSALQISPKQKTAQTNVASTSSMHNKATPHQPSTPVSNIKTKVLVDKSKLRLGSSSDLAESDLETESKRKISAEGIFIDKTAVDGIPFADESETDEHFYTPQTLERPNFSSVCSATPNSNTEHKTNISVKSEDQQSVSLKDSNDNKISLTRTVGVESNTPVVKLDNSIISPVTELPKKELAICSVFHSEASKRKDKTPSQRTQPVSVASKANCEDLSDEFSDESHVSFKLMYKKNDDLDARVARRLSKMHAKQQKRAEQRRLHMAQEIQRQLEEVEVRQRELEERGIIVEKLLRDGSDDDIDESQLMTEWFTLVHEKNALLRYESELNVRAKELELEDRQSRLELDYRERSKKSEKTELDIAAEGELLNELVEVVEQRNTLVAMLDEERLREQREDFDLKQIMTQKGFLLSSSDIRTVHENDVLHI